MKVRDFSNDSSVFFVTLWVFFTGEKNRGGGTGRPRRNNCRGGAAIVIYGVLNILTECFREDRLRRSYRN